MPFVPDKDIASITAEIFALVGDLSSDERSKIIKAVLALCGDELPVTASRHVDSAPAGRVVGDMLPKDPSPLGRSAQKWAEKHKISHSELEKIFYFGEETVEVHIDSVPGKSKKEQTRHCYLLTGIRAFLETDSPTIDDSEAISLCKHTKAYDKNNHTTNRKSLGPLVKGTREANFALSGPGLKSAAELIQSIIGSS